jgi:two-component system, NarL family, response regulator DevR
VRSLQAAAGMAPMTSGSVRVLVVDDHEVVRRGVHDLIAATDDLTVCAEAGSTREALAAAERTTPDVVVMDIRLADGTGIQATRDIRSRRPQTRVLMFTSFPDEEALFASIMAGASGFVLKEIKGSNLLEAIRAVARGDNLLDPQITGVVLERLRNGGQITDERLARLSAQEHKILSLVAGGMTNGEIASRVNLAEKTVKNYVSVILRKLEVARRAQAAAYFSQKEGLAGRAGPGM